MTDTWGEQLEATAQELYDLAANGKIKLEIEGELGDLTGTLSIFDAYDGKWSMVASGPRGAGRNTRHKSTHRSEV